MTPAPDQGCRKVRCFLRRADCFGRRCAARGAQSPCAGRNILRRASSQREDVHEAIETGGTAGVGVKNGDAVRLTESDAGLAAGAVGVVVDVLRNNGSAVLLVEFEEGRRVVSPRAVEQLTKFGGPGPTEDAVRP